jgi:hypothetical protein
MSDEGLNKLVRMSHIGEDESKVVLRCSQQVRTEHDGERFRCHVVLVLKVGDSGRNSQVNALFCQEEDALVEVFSDALQ